MPFAFIFPGQGSQAVGMLSNISKEYPVIKKTFYEASTVCDYDLWTLVQKGPPEELNKTWKTQPAILTASIALWRIWKEKKGKIPTLMAGHSLGEYSALVCAGVINFIDAVRLVEKRGKFMQDAVPKEMGSMKVIIGLDDYAIVEICRTVARNQIVSAVNFNSPKQVVIAGHKDAVQRAGMACKAAGAKYVVSLPISVPSHCELMKPAAKKLEEELKKISFNTPIIPVVNNVDVECHTRLEDIRDALIRQLYNPVQWKKTIQFMSKRGIKHVYEVGPGMTLTKLTKHIVNTLTASTLNTSDSILDALSQ